MAKTTIEDAPVAEAAEPAPVEASATEAAPIAKRRGLVLGGIIAGGVLAAALLFGGGVLVGLNIPSGNDGPPGFGQGGFTPPAGGLPGGPQQQGQGDGTGTQQGGGGQPPTGNQQDDTDTDTN